MGGALGAAFGWRAAFAICGLPGVALAVLCLYIEEPTKGASEVDLPAGVTVADGAFDTQQDQDHEQQQRTLSVESHTEMSTSGRPSLLGHKHRSFSTGRGGGGSDDDLPYTGGGDDDTPYSGGGGGNGDDLSAGKVHAEIIVNAGWMSALRVMWADKAFVYTLVGVTLVTFASGGMADWFTTYLIRVQGFAETEASTYSGLMTVVGGIGGTISGSVLSDRMKASGRVALPEFVMMASSILLSAVFAFAALSVPGTSKFLVVLFLFLTQYFLWFYSGPSNAVMCNVHVSVRARAFAISILVQHALGDAIASPVIGAISGAGAGANTPSRREIQSNMSGKEPNKEPNN